MNRRSIFLAALAGASAIVGFAPYTASAQVNAGAPTIVVKLTGVDLATRHGAWIAFVRINEAADLVCGGKPFIAELSRMRSYRICSEDAVRRAVVSLNQPAVSELLSNYDTQVATR